MRVTKNIRLTGIYIIRIVKCERLMIFSHPVCSMRVAIFWLPSLTTENRCDSRVNQLSHRDTHQILCSMLPVVF